MKQIFINHVVDLWGKILPIGLKDVKKTHFFLSIFLFVFSSTHI